jgi:hypothetical protein
MAGDMETLAFITKMEHSKRVLFLHKDKKKTILFSDIKNGVDNFFENKGLVDNANDNVMSHIYM